MNHIKLIIAMGCVASLAACGTSVSADATAALPPDLIKQTQSAPAQVQGTALGDFQGTHSAAYAVVNGYPVVMVANIADLCGSVTAGTMPGNVTTLGFTIARDAAGSYAVDAPHDSALGWASAVISMTDAQCSPVATNGTAESGTVTLAARAGDAPLVGTYDLTVSGKSGHFKGGFLAVNCPALSAAVSGSTLACGG